MKTLDNGQTRITGYLDEDDHRRLRVLAAERGVRVTVLLREMVRQGLEAAEQSRDADAAERRWQDRRRSVHKQRCTEVECAPGCTMVGA